MPIDTHSGAIEGFRLLPAVEHAAQDNFDGVQLFINDELLDPVQFELIVNAILSSDLTNLVLHLPNSENLKPEHLEAADRLAARLPEDLKWYALIHLEEKVNGATRDLEYSEVPMVGGKPVCIENSKTGVFDKSSVIKAVRLARALNAGFVFDIGRIMYPSEDGTVDAAAVYQFIHEILYYMNPATDIIHTAGKLSWGKRFREAACAFGAEGDITLPIKHAISEFHRNGGVVVFEHEDKDMIIESKKNLLEEV